MKIIQHDTFDCSEPETFNWKQIIKYYPNHYSIIKLIIDLIRINIRRIDNDHIVLGLRAALICFAIRLKLKKTNNNDNKGSKCNINNDSYYFVCDCNTIYLKENKENE